MSPAEQLPGKSPRRIATLDGWRAVAIFFVILDHACQHTRFHEAFWARLGNFGVDIFFVVSGYIITSRLLEERRQTSAINLSNFYRRRTFRILPIVVTYLCALLLLSLRIDLVDFHRSELVGALCFFRNYQLAADVRGIFTAHFWSLSIEEHFYLLWPGLLVLLGNRRALFLAMAGAVTSGALRTFELIHPIGAFQHMRGGAIILRTEMRLDGLMLGSAAAILLTDPRVRTFIFRNFP
ncbi:MAG: acyltransferase, partial [Acidobacteriaceae bacterium]|nr:acyltransferase [Acidobacteriaceae bacterium]